MRLPWLALPISLLAGCTPPPSEAPDGSGVTAVDPGGPGSAGSALPETAPPGDPATSPEPESTAPGPANPALCPADSHRQWTCGRPSGLAPDQTGKPVKISACPADGVRISHQWRLVSFPGAMQLDRKRTTAFRRRSKDEAGELVHDVCCYSACFPLKVRQKADPVPADQRVVPLCIAAGDRPSSTPATVRPDCPAAVELPGRSSHGGFNPAVTSEHGPGLAKRAGFPTAQLCCYDGLQPRNITR